MEHAQETFDKNGEQMQGRERTSFKKKKRKKNFGIVGMQRGVKEILDEIKANVNVSPESISISSCNCPHVEWNVPLISLYYSGSLDVMMSQALATDWRSVSSRVGNVPFCS